MFWLDCDFSFRTELFSERFPFTVPVSGLWSLILACGTFSWGSSDATAGLKKETLLVDFLTPLEQACPFLFGESVCSVMPHCWFMASNLFFFIVSLVCFRLDLLAHCTLLEAFFLAALFLLLLLFLEHGEDDEPESWEDDVKLKIDMSRGWAELLPDVAGLASVVDLLSGEVTSEGVSTWQRTLRLRGLNQILKFFFCLKTEHLGSAWLFSGEQSAKNTFKHS